MTEKDKDPSGVLLVFALLVLFLFFFALVTSGFLSIWFDPEPEENQGSREGASQALLGTLDPLISGESA